MAERSPALPSRSPRPPVLVAEDDENIALYLKYMLHREGYNPVLRADGRAMIETIERHRPAALVLLDIKLPYVDGIQLVRALRARPGWERVPVVMLSSVSDKQIIDQALAAGADDYLIKPFTSDDLLARVHHHVPLAR